MTKRGAPLAFLLAALDSDTDDCIVWPFSIVAGYARVTYEGKPRQASHVVLELTGRLPVDADHPLGPMALHSCDDSACVNPRHLRWGTHAENMADVRERGRGLRRARWEAEEARRRERRVSPMGDTGSAA